MESIKTIFTNSLKENKQDAQLLPLVKELSYELGRKKLGRLKDPRHIQDRIGELFVVFQEALETEGLKTPKTITQIIDGLIKAASHEKEEFLYKTIYERDQLDKLILSQKNEIRSLIGTTFETLEKTIETLNDEVSPKAIHDSKLRGIEMLGILKETTEEAILTTIEKGIDIEDTVFEITKNITYQAILEGSFTKQRFLDIASSVIEVAIEIADEDQAFAKEILSGTIHGAKEGISRAVEKFKNDLKYAPEEVEVLLNCDLDQTKKELMKIEEQFVVMVKNCGSLSDGVAGKIIKDMLENELDNSLAKMQRITHEAREVVSERVEELKEKSMVLEKELKAKAEARFETLKKDVEDLANSPKTKQATEEAKKLGNRAWEAAKDLVKNAKDKIKKEG